MNFISIFYSVIFASFISITSLAQSLDVLNIVPPSSYRVNTAIFINGKQCDNAYFNKDKPQLDLFQVGKLTVATVPTCQNATKSGYNVKFQVAIRNARTNTMYSYTREGVMEVDLGALLSKCEMDDYIIIMTADQKFKLTKNEMYIAMGGC